MEEKIEINEQNEQQKKPQKKPMSPKKKVKIIIASMIGALILFALLIWLIDLIMAKRGEYTPPPPVDSSKLYETYEEGFDIMEYEEYLELNRTIFRYDPQIGVTESVDDESCHLYGRPFEIMYNLIKAINAGDNVAYNSYMGNSALCKGGFTQQQIYDIVIKTYRTERVNGENGSYDQVIFEVTYKIHENNGTFRNNIEPDVSRPEYYFVNNRTGDFKVMDIRDRGY